MTDYTLTARVDYMRRDTMPSLLFSLAQKAIRDGLNGEQWEQVHCHLTGDGDYMALAIVDTGKERAVGQAGDDIGAADRIINQDERDEDEGSRLRRIEAFKQAEAQRLAALREQREGQ